MPRAVGLGDRRSSSRPCPKRFSEPSWLRGTLHPLSHPCQSGRRCSLEFWRRVNVHTSDGEPAHSSPYPRQFVDPKGDGRMDGRASRPDPQSFHWTRPRAATGSSTYVHLQRAHGRADRQWAHGEGQGRLQRVVTEQAGTGTGSGRRQDTRASQFFLPVQHLGNANVLLTSREELPPPAHGRARSSHLRKRYRLGRTFSAAWESLWTRERHLSHPPPSDRLELPPVLCDNSVDSARLIK